MKKYILWFSFFILAIPTYELATQFFASPTGSGTTCSTGAPCDTVTMLGKLNAGDVGTLKNGTYTGDNFMIHPPTGRSGTSGSHITLNTETDGGVFINGQNARVPVVWDNNDWWDATGFDAGNSNSDVMQIFPGSSNNTFKRICAFNGNPTGNWHVWSFWQAPNNLAEDVCGFGSARKMFESFELSGLTIRRAYAQWNLQNTDSGPFISSSLMYNSDNVTIENMIATKDEDMASIESASDNGLLSMDRLNEYSDCNVNSGYFGSIAYTLGAQRMPSGSGNGGLLHASQEAATMIFKDNIVYVQPGFYPNLQKLLMPVYDPRFTAGCAATALTSGRQLTNTSTIGSVGASPDEIHTDAPFNGWTVNNYRNGTTLAAIYGSNSIYNALGAGAEIRYQTVNRVVTTTPLWPWSMDARIDAAFVRAGRTPPHVEATMESIFGVSPDINPVPSSPQENFSFYTIGNDLASGAGGLNWTSGWANNLTEQIFVATAPTGMLGKVAQSSDADGTFAGYSRNFTASTAGFMDAVLVSSINNNNDVMRFEIGDSSSAQARLAFTNDGFLSFWNGASFTHIIATVASARNQVHIEWDNVAQPNKFRVQVNGGSFSAWTTVLGGTYTALTSVGINDHATNAHNYSIGYINGASRLTSISPSTFAQGATYNATLTFSGSSLVNGTSTFALGDSTGISINSLTVTDATHATANFTVSGSAPTTARDIYVSTGTNESEVMINGLTITSGTPIIPNNGGGAVTIHFH